MWELSAADKVYIVIDRKMPLLIKILLVSVLEFEEDFL